MRLGELLVQSGKISAADLQEALEAQVVHGGRLGTNLLELGLLEEKELAAALGKLHGVQFAAGTMAPDPRALEKVEPEFSDEHDVVPMRMDATRLSVAVINPQDLGTLDALAFKTGRRVVPVVVPEFRMHQLLRTHCQAFRTLRAIDIEGPRRRARSESGGPSGSELMSEEEFQSLYAQVLSGAGDPPAEASATPELSLAEPILLTRPRRPASPLHSAEPEPEPQPVPNADLHVGPPGQPLPVGMGPPAQVVPLLTPLTFQDAQAKLSASTDREEIAQTVLRFALGKWKRVLLLSVQGELVLGWHGMGSQVRDAAVRRMAVPLRPGNTFRLVRDTRSHFVGPLKRDAATLVFFQLLGGGTPTTAVMLPLLVRGKVVHLLYVDNGPGQLTTPDVGELLILSQNVARSYELLIAARARG